MIKKPKNIDKDKILIHFEKDKKWISQQILNTLSEVLTKEEISNNNYFYLTIENVHIINKEFFVLQINLNKFNDSKLFHTTKIIFKDEFQKIYAIKDFRLKDVFQILLDDELINYNYKKEPFNNYFFISNLLPHPENINQIKNKTQKIFNIFFNQILPNKILSKMYTYPDIIKGKTNIYNVKLSNPKLSLGYFPNNQSSIKITANITLNKFSIKDDFIIDINFYTFNNFKWIYDNVENDFLFDDFYYQIMINELEKITNDENKVFNNDDFSLNFSKYDDLNKTQEFIKLKENQQPEHIFRFMNLYEKGFIKSIKQLNYDSKNNIIKCFFVRQPYIEVIFGENGIVTNENDILYSPLKNKNNTLIDAKKNLLILNNLPLKTNYIEEPINFEELVINDINLIVDVYNKRKTMKNLETYAKLNNKLEEKLKQKGIK